MMDQLERECRAFTQYLTGEPPHGYVVEKYRDFHRQGDIPAVLPVDRFDQFLLHTSARGPYWARLADSYASRFRKSAAVRKKLVLTLAILECAPQTFEQLDAVKQGGLIGAFLRMGLGTVLYICNLALAIALFAPARIALSIARRSRQAAVAERS
jgi:hypothetical protein